MSSAPRVLVVEDDDIARSFATTVLAQAGLVVDSCSTAREARARLDRQDWDLVVMDLGLPDGGGPRLVRFVCDIGSPKLLVLTGDEAAAAELGSDVDILIKPVYPERLVARVGALLQLNALAQRMPRRLRALVVDDDPVFRDFIATLLRTDVWEVETVASAAQACLALDRPQLPHLVVLDLSMPTIDGMAVATRIATQRPGLGLLIVTGDPTRIPSASQMAEVLAKPVEPRQFLATARRLARTAAPESA